MNDQPKPTASEVDPHELLAVPRGRRRGRVPTSINDVTGDWVDPVDPVDDDAAQDWDARLWKSGR